MTGQCTKAINVLIIGDNPGDAQMVREALGGSTDPDYRIEGAECLSSGLDRLASRGIDVILLDLDLAGSEGLVALARVRVLAPAVPVVALSCAGDEQLAVEVVKAGAQDCLVKAHVNSYLLTRSLRYAIERELVAETLRESEESLRESNQGLHRFSRDLLRTQDYERRRISRELHDSTAQLLAALSINLVRLGDFGLNSPRRQQALSEAIDLAAACSAEIRTVTYLLHPPLLDAVGLAAGLQAYAKGFGQRTGIRVEIRIAPDFGRLGRELESALFCIAQEGLANVHKHSGSPSAVVRIERDAWEVQLTVQDLGRGLPAAPLEQSKGFVSFGTGITGIRERAEQFGGRLEFDSGDFGAALTVTLPVVYSNEENSNTAGRRS